jgi:hypothetical protein
VKRVIAASVAALTMTSCAATQAQPSENDEPRTLRSVSGETEDRRPGRDGPDMGEMLERVEDWDPNQIALAGNPLPCEGDPGAVEAGDEWREASLDDGLNPIRVLVPPSWRVDSSRAMQTEDGRPSAVVMVIPSPGAIPSEFRDEAMSELATAYDKVKIAERLEETTCLIGGHMADGTETYNLVHLPDDGPAIFLAALVYPGAGEESADEVIRVLRSAKFAG